MGTKLKKLESKQKGKEKTSSQPPSSNWLALQKKLPKRSASKSILPPRKKRRLGRSDGPRSDDVASEAGQSTAGSHQAKSIDGEPASFPRGRAQISNNDLPVASPSAMGKRNSDGSESLDNLRKMVLGQVDYTEAQTEPGKYLAMDCEMVGVGLDGAESSLARVSLVNYHGAVILDEFVRQRERVVDYRTAVSGIRDTDMVKAKPFVEVQKKVAEVLKDRILIGHAVFNDLKALLLSHPRPLTRDTQLCAGKAKLLKTKYPALRKLVQQELGIAIQAGEHSSVTDARATMALYRLHRKEWDKGFRPLALVQSKKRKAPHDDEEIHDRDDENVSDVDEQLPRKSKKKEEARKQTGVVEFPGGGRKGVSSGLSTITRRSMGRAVKGGSSPAQSRGSKEKWWTTLGGTTASNGAKGSMKLKAC